MTISTPATETPGMPAKVGVLGGGRMGAGIAHAFLVSGAHVTVVERDADSAAAARDRVTGTLSKAIEKAAVSEDLESLLRRFTASTDAADFGGSGLVVEAVPEDFTLKQAALRTVERTIGADAWIATNTSSLSVSRLADSLGSPERLCGLHFFNPVPASTLVEVVLGPAPPGTGRSSGQLGSRARQDANCGPGRPRLRQFAAGRCPRARSHAHA